MCRQEMVKERKGYNIAAQLESNRRHCDRSMWYASQPLRYQDISMESGLFDDLWFVRSKTEQLNLKAM